MQGPAGMSTSQRTARRDLLANVEIFEGLQDPILDLLVDASSTRKLDRGEYLCHAGEPGSQLYGVIKGRLKVLVSGPSAKDVVFGYTDPGQVIGEIALLDAHPRSASVVAVEPSELLSLQRRDLLPILGRHPEVGIQLAEVLAGRVRRLTELAQGALSLPLPTRLAKKLLELDAQYGESRGDERHIDLTLNQQELADLVGITRESTNKHLRAWAQEGLLRFERGRLTLLDREGLESVASLSVL